jgi:hypothetical protein
MLGAHEKARDGGLRGEFGRERVLRRSYRQVTTTPEHSQDMAD